MNIYEHITNKDRYNSTLKIWSLQWKELELMWCGCSSGSRHPLGALVCVPGTPFLIQLSVNVLGKAMNTQMLGPITQVGYLKEVPDFWLCSGSVLAVNLQVEDVSFLLSL